MKPMPNKKGNEFASDEELNFEEIEISWNG